MTLIIIKLREIESWSAQFMIGVDGNNLDDGDDDDGRKTVVDGKSLYTDYVLMNMSEFRLTSYVVQYSIKPL
jgi:hypothetical protein